MKLYFNLLVFLFLSFTSCVNDSNRNETLEVTNPTADPKQEFEKLNTFLRKFDQPVQIFRFPTTKPINVKGKQGTVISIVPSDLEMENGQPIGEELVIELKELSTQQHFVRANAQTVSDGNLLISGGAINISVTTDGQSVKLKSGKTYSVEFPKFSDDEMSLYYGQSDSLNRMNWKPADQKFEAVEQIPKSGLVAKMVLTKSISKDTTTISMEEKSQEEIRKLEEENKLNDKIYQPIAMNRFGWINCDRIYLPNTPVTDINLEVTNSPDEVNYVNVYLLFKDINTVRQTAYFQYDGKIEGNIFENIPVGMNVSFLAVAYQHGKIYAKLTEKTVVKENHVEKMLLTEMNEKEFEKLIIPLN